MVGLGKVSTLFLSTALFQTDNFKMAKVCTNNKLKTKKENGLKIHKDVTQGGCSGLGACGHKCLASEDIFLQNCIFSPTIKPDTHRAQYTAFLFCPVSYFLRL